MKQTRILAHTSCLDAATEAVASLLSVLTSVTDSDCVSCTGVCMQMRVWGVCVCVFMWCE